MARLKSAPAATSTLAAGGGVGVGPGPPWTLIVMSHRDWLPLSSVTEKISTREPACAAVGVQFILLLTPVAPVTGKAGVDVAPWGKPLLLISRLSPVSGSVALTVKETGVPGATESG